MVYDSVKHKQLKQVTVNIGFLLFDDHWNARRLHHARRRGAQPLLDVDDTFASVSQRVSCRRHKLAVRADVDDDVIMWDILFLLDRSYTFE